MIPFVLLLVAGIFVCAFWVARLARTVRSLEAERTERRAALVRTSKLLVEKNMELFDQNLRQQRELESKEDFIGIVSHQLRTPATEVKWGVEALEHELDGHAKGLERAYFDRLKASAERMVRLINSLVRLMAIDERYRRPVVTPYELDPVVRAASEGVAKRFADKHINLTLVLGAPGMIQSLDEDSLALVTENLVENAYEYTPESGRVSVTTGREGESFICTVADTGVGIPEEKRRTMFVRFQRSADALRMNAGGMGLGLYLVKNVVERVGGTIAFTSEEEKGSSFRVTLPPVHTSGSF